MREAKLNDRIEQFRNQKSAFLNHKNELSDVFARLHTGLSSVEKASSDVLHFASETPLPNAEDQKQKSDGGERQTAQEQLRRPSQEAQHRPRPRLLRKSSWPRRQRSVRYHVRLPCPSRS